MVRLSQNTSTGALTAADFFSPANAPTLDRQDGDLGSGGAVGLPFGTSTYPHLLVQAGKDHRIFLLNRDSLGGRETGPGGTDNPVFIGGPYGGQWGHPAAYAGAGGADYVYYSGSGGGSSDYLRVLRFNGHTSAHPELQDVANSPASSATRPVRPSSPRTATSTPRRSSGRSTTPMEPVSAPGWRRSTRSRRPAHATLTELWSAPIGTAAKFSVPATDGGHVYVGNRSDIVYGFGVSNALPLVSGQVSFGSVSVARHQDHHRDGHGRPGDGGHRRVRLLDRLARAVHPRDASRRRQGRHHVPGRPHGRPAADRPRHLRPGDGRRRHRVARHRRRTSRASRR